MPFFLPQFQSDRQSSSRLTPQDRLSKCHPACSTQMPVLRTSLRLLTASCALMLSTTHALTVEPVRVKSSLGEPFRAELVITDIAGINPANIRVGLADSTEFARLGIPRSRLSNHLHFNTLITSPERGVITITSDEPLNDPYLEFVVHIGFGTNVRLQQVTALVDPPLTHVQTEHMDLPVQKIQLAESTAPAPTPTALPAQTSAQPAPAPQAISAAPATSASVQDNAAPLAAPPAQATPVMAPIPAVPRALTQAPETPIAIPADNSPVAATPATPPQPVITPAPVVAPAPVAPTANMAQAAAPVTPPASPSPTADNKTNPASAPQTASVAAGAPTASSYTVQKNDSLWAIATHMQKDSRQPIPVIMRYIQQMNKSAFIGGNPNQIRNGATIVLPDQKEIEQFQANLNQPAKIDNDDTESHKLPDMRSKTATTTNTKTPYVRRGQLPDAKMTLVAPPEQGSAQGNSNTGNDAHAAAVLQQLQNRIGLSRATNASMAREINELEAKIKANEQKLALQNARLAELVQRIKQRKESAAPNHN